MAMRLLEQPTEISKGIGMVLTTDSVNRKLVLTFDEDGWSVVKYLNKVFGTTFIKNFLEKFFNERAFQRQSVRSEKIGGAWQNATTDKKQEVLNILGVELNDE